MKRLIAVLYLFAVTALSVTAQSSAASLSGIITDPQGAAVADAA